jgi:hypothetical protein
MQELIDEIYRDKVLRARQQPSESKLLDGPRLHEYACSIASEAIRSQRPGISDEEVLAILRERLALRERLERRR